MVYSKDITRIKKGQSFPPIRGQDVLRRCLENPNLCIPYLLMASFLYYHCDLETPLNDSEFDELCRLALKKWKTIKHRHKRLITEDDLQAGSLYALPLRRYPLITQNAAKQWYLTNLKGKPGDAHPQPTP